MTADICQSLNRSLNGYHALEEEKHLGLKNIHERIKIMFGDEYGIKIHGEENQGTTVTAIMPVVR